MQLSNHRDEDQVFVMLDSTPRTEKPTDEEAKRIDCKLKAAQLTLKELSDHVLNGETWCPGVFNGKRANESFIQAQLVAVDMDGGIEPAEALEICKTYDIPPCWGYYSFSHKVDQPRYRLVWRIDHILGCKDVYEIASEALCNLFKGTADRSCLSASSRFYGTCNGQFLFEPDNVVTLEAIVDAYCSEEYSRDKTNASKKIEGYASSAGLEVAKPGLIDLTCLRLAGPFTIQRLADRLSHKSVSIVRLPPNTSSGAPGASLPPASVTNSGEPFYIYMRSSSISNLSDAMGPTTTPGGYNNIPEGTCPERYSKGMNIAKGLGPAGRKLLEKVDFKHMEQHCRLYREHSAGKPLSHNETFGLLTSLLKCKGGETQFMRGLKIRKESKLEPRYIEIWHTQEKRVKTYNYFPQHCKNFCPYCDECSHINTPLDQLPLRRGQWRKAEQPNSLITLSEAETRCAESINKVISKRDGKIHLLIFGTALGKTSHIIGKKDFILCAPTHRLALQMVSDAQKLGNNPIYVPDLPSVDNNFDEMIAEYYRVGDTKGARSLIYRRYCEAESKSLEFQSLGERELIEYEKTLQELKNPQGRLVICTHKRLLLMEELPYDMVVFDEDVLFKSQLDVVGFELADFQSIACFDTLINFITGKNRNIVYKIPKGIFPKRDELQQELKGKDIPDNIYRILNTDRCMLDPNGKLVFGHKWELCKEPTIVVLSATANKELYQAANPNREVVLEADVTNIEHVGNVIQYPNWSLSLNSVKQGRADSALDAISTFVGDVPVITIKSEQDYLRSHGFNVHSLHQDNCEGSNELEGQNIAVISTPNKNEAAYRMYANLLNIPVNSDDELKYAAIKRHGWEFDAMTYPNNSQLQNLQLHLIESTLIQAVGRARALRKDCTCRIFSNVIIPNVEVEKFVPTEPRSLHLFEGVTDREPINCQYKGATKTQSGGVSFSYEHNPTGILVIRTYDGRRQLSVHYEDDGRTSYLENNIAYNVVDPNSGRNIVLSNISVALSENEHRVTITGQDDNGNDCRAEYSWGDDGTVTKPLLISEPMERLVA